MKHGGWRPGGGRPRIDSLDRPLVRLGMWITQDHDAYLTEMARRLRVNRSEVVRRLLSIAAEGMTYRSFTQDQDEEEE